MKARHPRYLLHDGTNLSIQASYLAYSAPREDIGPYEAAEVHIGFGKEPPDSWEQYRNDSVELYYAYVPIQLIENLIEARGGIDFGRTL